MLDNTVRYYTHMHSVELGKDPKVKAVAKLVAQVFLQHHEDKCLC